MKILLQNTKTFKFVGDYEHQSAQSWTSERASARIFATGLEAVSHCYQRGITNMQMFVTFDDSDRNFTVSVTDTLTG